MENSDQNRLCQRGADVADGFGRRSSTAIRCQQLTPGNKPKCLSTVGFTSPPFAFLRSFTSTQGQEDAACQEHRRDKCCEIQIDRRCQSASRMRLPRVGPQLPNAVNLWPKRHRAGTTGAPRRRPSASPVGYGANVRKQWYTAHQENGWLQCRSLRGS